MSRRNPFRELEELFERMSRDVDGVGIEALGAGAGAVAVDVAETDAEFVVTADLPGYDREDIDVTLDDRELTVAAERDRESTERGEADDRRFLRRERSHSAVSRTVYVPEAVDAENVTATYRNGVLTVTLPKAEAGDEGHQIDVE
jgi:HSP20 family protein